MIQTAAEDALAAQAGAETAQGLAEDAADAAALSETNAAASENAAAASEDDAETAALAAQAAGNYFVDTTAGIAGTVNGEYFFVPDGNGNLDLYLNNSGTAVAQGYSIAGVAYLESILATVADTVENIVDPVQHIGPAVAVAGTSIGNVTVILDPVVRDISRIRVQAVWRASGTLKIRAWNETNGSVTSVTQAVSAGDNTYEIAIPIKQGDRIALFGNGLIDRTGNAGPGTGYYSLAGDVSSGALSTQVKNFRVDVSIDLYGVGDETRAAGDAVAQTGTRVRYPGLSYGAASLGTALSDSNNAWGDPRILPSGILRQLKVTPETNGWFSLILAQIVDHQLDLYRTIQIDGSSGTVTLTDESETIGQMIPKDCFIRPDTIALWFCPTSAGKISYTTTDGPNPVGENLIGALLPVGNLSCSPVLGLQTPAYSSSNRFYSAEFVVDEFINSNPDDVIYSQDFGGTARPVEMIETGGAWTYSAGSATSSATGRNAHLRSRFAYCFDNRTLRFRVAFSSISSTISVGTRPTVGAYGTVVRLDHVTGNVSVGSMGGATSDPVYFVTETWPGTFSTAKDYEVTIGRKDRVVSVAVREVGGAPLWTYRKDMDEAQIPPVSDPESATLDDIGLVNGAAFAYADAGAIIWKSLVDSTPDKNADLLILGDSIMNSSRVAYGDGFAQQLRELRQGRTAIMAVDGWDAINMCNVMRRIVPRMPKLKNVLVGAGTNRGSSDDARALNIFEAQVAAMKLTADEYGLGFYFAMPAPFNDTVDYPGTTLQADELAWIVQQDGIKLLRYDLALTESDGVTINDALYYGPNDPHPIAAGHDAVVERFYTDAPELL
jgi:hypothetical protein